MEYFSCWGVFLTAKMRENVLKTGTWPEFHKANPCKPIKSAHFWIDVNVDLSRFTSTVYLSWNFNTNTTKLQAFMFRASSTIFAKAVFRKKPCKRLGLNVSFMHFSSLFRPCDPNFEMRRSETHTSLFERTACQSNLESINKYQQFLKHFTRYTYMDTTNNLLQLIIYWYLPPVHRTWRADFQAQLRPWPGSTLERAGVQSLVGERRT